MALSNVDFRASENLRKFELFKTWEDGLKLCCKRRTFEEANASGNVNVVERTQERGIAIISGRSENYMPAVRVVDEEVQSFWRRQSRVANLSVSEISTHLGSSCPQTLYGCHCRWHRTGDDSY